MTQHAFSLPPSTSPEPTYAERVRTLLESERVGTLATQSLLHPGFPFASVMPYALMAEGIRHVSLGVKVLRHEIVPGEQGGRPRRRFRNVGRRTETFQRLGWCCRRRRGGVC
jgi:putative heme iron utilization protein